MDTLINKKAIIPSLIIFIVITLLSGCQKTEDEGIYISFTRTSKALETTIFEFNLSDEEVNAVGFFTYNAQYPLGVYSRENNKMYYSAKAEDGHGDQLWEYDIETEERTQLTDGIYGMNFIVPVDDSIYLVAWCFDNDYNALNLYCYDIESRSLELLQDDPAFNIGVLSYSPENKEFMFAGEDAVEMWHRFDIQCNEYPFYPPTNNVYSMKDNVIKLVFSTEDNEDIVALAMNDQYILYRTISESWTLHEDGSFTGDTKEHVYLMNRETNDKTEITDEVFSHVGKFIYLANSGDFYCLYYGDGYNQIVTINLDDLSYVHKIHLAPSNAFAINNGIALN
ncbi:MAG: hypothetical protein VB012_03260 [Erysipelotrichaceae bacterium]|nr:hypothetical protein [Erysipelotrichaceae bacterium]